MQAAAPVFSRAVAMDKAEPIGPDPSASRDLRASPVCASHNSLSKSDSLDSASAAVLLGTSASRSSLGQSSTTVSLASLNSLPESASSGIVRQLPSSLSLSEDGFSRSASDLERTASAESKLGFSAAPHRNTLSVSMNSAVEEDNNYEPRVLLQPPKPLEEKKAEPSTTPDPRPQGPTDPTTPFDFSCGRRPVTLKFIQNEAQPKRRHRIKYQHKSQRERVGGLLLAAMRDDVSTLSAIVDKLPKGKRVPLCAAARIDKERCTVWEVAIRAGSTRVLRYLLTGRSGPFERPAPPIDPNTLLLGPSRLPVLHYALSVGASLPVFIALLAGGANPSTPIPSPASRFEEQLAAQLRSYGLSPDDICACGEPGASPCSSSQAVLSGQALCSTVSALFRSPLRSALDRGVPGVVQQLIETRVDPTAIQLIPCQTAAPTGRHEDAILYALTKGLFVSPKRLFAAYECALSQKHFACAAAFASYIEPDYTNRFRRTALHMACASLNARVIDSALSAVRAKGKTAVINLEDARGNTPLRLSLAEPSGAALTMLLGHAELDVNDCASGRLAVDIAFEEQNGAAVDALIKAGAVLRPQWPPCSFKVSSRFTQADHDNCVNLMVARSAVLWDRSKDLERSERIDSLTANDDKCTHAVWSVLLSKHMVCFQKIVHAAPIELLVGKANFRFGSSLLHHACSPPNLEAVRSLLDRLGPFATEAVDQRDARGRSPLFLASERWVADAEEVIALLISRRRQDARFDLTPFAATKSLLHFLARNGCAKAMQLALLRPEFMDTLHSRDANNDTPLLLACKDLSEKSSPALRRCIELLTTASGQAGAIDALDSNGVTAARVLFQKRERGPFQTMLRAGADIAAATLRPCLSHLVGKPLPLTKGHIEYLETFKWPLLVKDSTTAIASRKKSATLVYPSNAFASLVHEHTRCFKLFLSIESHEALCATDENGNNLFHAACLTADSTALHYLVARDDIRPTLINAPNKQGNTPLHLACRFHTSSCFFILASCPDCDLSVKNQEGKTPFDCTAAFGVTVDSWKYTNFYRRDSNNKRLSEYSNPLDKNYKVPSGSQHRAIAPSIRATEMGCALFRLNADYDLSTYALKLYFLNHADLDKDPNRLSHPNLHRLFRAMASRNANLFTLLKPHLIDDVISIVLDYCVGSLVPPGGGIVCEVCDAVLRSMPSTRALSRVEPLPDSWSAVVLAAKSVWVTT